MLWNNNHLFCNDLITHPQTDMGTILVSGASGYIGGRLVPELLARGYRVRVMVRAYSPVYSNIWPNAEVYVVDALDKIGLKRALRGIHTAYYLIHSMSLGKKKFEEIDIKAAINFREAAQTNRIKHIIYLGGLGDTRECLSPHLRSRIEVASELRKGDVPVTVLRAAVIIGSGSASYEIIKNLVKRLPIIFTPTWARTKCQPIGIRDVIKYLVGVMESNEVHGKSFDIGGSEILTYEKMMKRLAKFLGKKRIFIPLPFSLIPIYSYLTSFFTPVPAKIIMCLMGGCKNQVVCQQNDILKILPFHRLTYKEAIVRAMSREEQDKISTRWSDAYPPAHELAIKLNELQPPPNYSSSYSIVTKKEISTLFRNICQVGGTHGWFNSNFLWRLRGMIDRLLMGVGTARGRRSNTELRINDVVDFWRVEDLKINQMLLLRAEMKLPGKAWLKFNIDKEKDKNRISIKAYFFTQSIWGKIYWYMFLPFHRYIFFDIIHQVVKRS